MLICFSLQEQPSLLENSCRTAVFRLIIASVIALALFAFFLSLAHSCYLTLKHMQELTHTHTHTSWGSATGSRLQRLNAIWQTDWDYVKMLMKAPVTIKEQLCVCNGGTEPGSCDFCSLMLFPPWTDLHIWHTCTYAFPVLCCLSYTKEQ